VSAQAVRRSGGFTAATSRCRTLRKRAAGVPTYSVPEAAALLSVSQEHLYRLVRADAFPAVRMRLGGDQGRYVVPAKAVEKVLDAATDGGGCIDIAEWAKAWQADLAGRATPWGGDAS
jgi:excisionase family DNA binding protein